MFEELTTEEMMEFDGGVNWVNVGLGIFGLVATAVGIVGGGALAIVGAPIAMGAVVDIITTAGAALSITAIVKGCID